MMVNKAETCCISDMK